MNDTNQTNQTPTNAQLDAVVHGALGCKLLYGGHCDLDKGIYPSYTTDPRLFMPLLMEILEEHHIDIFRYLPRNPGDNTLVFRTGYIDDDITTDRPNPIEAMGINTVLAWLEMKGIKV